MKRAEKVPSKIIGTLEHFDFPGENEELYHFERSTRRGVDYQMCSLLVFRFREF